MNVSVLRNGVQVYAREQAFGGFLLTQDIMRHFGMSLEEAEAPSAAGSLPKNYESDLLRPFMDALALEVSRRCSSSSPPPSSTRSTTSCWPGGCAVIPGLAETVAGRTQVGHPDRQSLREHEPQFQDSPEKPDG